MDSVKTSSSQNASGLSSLAHITKVLKKYVHKTVLDPDPISVTIFSTILNSTRRTRYAILMELGQLQIISASAFEKEILQSLLSSLAALSLCGTHTKSHPYSVICFMILRDGKRNLFLVIHSLACSGQYGLCIAMTKSCTEMQSFKEDASSTAATSDAYSSIVDSFLFNRKAGPCDLYSVSK